MSNKLFGSKQQHASPPPAFYYNPNGENVPPTSIVLTSPSKSKVSTPRKMLGNLKAKVMRKPLQDHNEQDVTSTSSTNSDDQVNQAAFETTTPKRTTHDAYDFQDFDNERQVEQSPESVPVSMNENKRSKVIVEKKILKKAPAQEPSSPSDNEVISKDLTALSDKLNSSVFDKQFSDFVIQCGPGLSTKYYAHRVILAARSTYFRALLSNTSSSLHQTQSTRFSWEREDLHPEVFGKVIEYMYTGQIRLKLDNVLDLFVQSEEFGIACLKRLCEIFLIEHTDFENVALLLEMAVDNKANELIKHCCQYIDKNIKRVLKSESLKNVKCSTLTQIISRDTLELDPLEEVLIFEAVEKWCSMRKHLPGEISTIIEHVRYPLMSSEQLANVVEPTSLVPQHPLLFEAYKYHLVPEKTNQAPRFRNRAGSKQ